LSRTPKIPDAIVTERFNAGMTDEQIREGYDNADAHYVFRRRMILRLLRGREAAAEPKAKKSRHGSHKVNSPASRPAIDNAAFDESRTIFVSTVVDVSGLNNLLVSGDNSRKIGGTIEKGPARGFPIFTLTLEERKTCPVCAHWRSCVVPGTKVLTADLTWVPIEDLAPGREIVGFDEERDPATGVRKSKIASVHRVGRAVRECYELTTDRGIIIASDDHLWLAKKDRAGFRWFRNDKLSPGDLIKFLVAPWDVDTSYDAGRLRGFVEGEGTLSTWGNGPFTKSEVSWSQAPGPLIGEINEIARRKGFSITTDIRISGVNDSEVTINSVDGGWRETLRFMGTIRPSRLFAKVRSLIEDRSIEHRGTQNAVVKSIRYIGPREVVMIETSSKTLFTDGYASHNCYGNNMHHAKRVRHGPAFEERLALELALLQSRYPRGFAIRLHVLGDFYSVEYVRLWESFLARFPAMFVFGFSARWRRDDPIAVALVDLVLREWDEGRFRVRFSDAPVDECSTVSIEHPRQAPADAIICPAQTGRTESCGTCGLCWHTKRRIAFLQH